MIAEIDKDILLMPEIIRHLMISLVKEGVTIAQLFTPEKEEALIATLAKEKMEPSKPHQTRASRGRITPKVETVEAPKILNNPPAGGQDDDAKKTLSVQDDKEIEKAVDVDIIKPVIEETADESAKRRAELDKKLDELLKEE